MSALLVLSLLMLPLWAATWAKAMRAAKRRTSDWVTADDGFVEPDPPPKVSVLIAARNEEASLGRCLESLRAQKYANLEVIVVDDRSEDGTHSVAMAHAAADPRVIALRADALPDGWYGKPHALYLAASHAKGEWLLLTDADTVHRERAVTNGIVFAQSKGARAVSLVGEMNHPTLISNLVTPQLYAILALVIERRRRANENDVWGACGGYLLIERSAFDRAGGMTAVKAEIAEDIALARALVASGAKYAFGVGSPAVWRTESYGTLHEIDRGYARNENFRLRTVGAMIGATLMLWLLSIVPIATLIATLVSWEQISETARVLGLMQYALVLFVQAHIRRISRTRWWLAPLAPIGGLIAWSLLMRWSLGSAPIEWKGRTYAS